MLNVLTKSKRFKLIFQQLRFASQAAGYLGQDLANYRSLFSVSGVDSSVYLQNLITNNIHELDGSQNATSSALYAFILNNRGRVLFDTIIYNRSNGGFLLEIDTNLKNEAINLFKMLKIKKKVDINCVDNDYKLFSIFQPINNTFPIETTKLKINEELTLVTDPRYAPLGYRMIVKSDQTNQIKASAYLKNCQDLNDLSVYKKHLYSHGIAENSEDVFYAKGQILFLYLIFSNSKLKNIVFLNGVSFSKGCYLGQELVAKTHHTGVIRERIMPLKLTIDKEDGTPKFKKETEIINTQTNKSIGKLVNMIDTTGIGMIRLANIDINHMAMVDEQGKQWKVQVRIPSYWSIDEATKQELSTAKF